MTVSYCITLYNKEAYIAATLASVIVEWRQTGGEIIIYDDCSTDGSRRLVEPFAARGAVRVIAGERNIGLVLATDRLIREARAPHLKLVDADDRLLPGSTAYLRDALDRLGADLICGRIVSQAEAARRTPRDDMAVVVSDAIRRFLRGMPCNVSAMLLRTAAAKAALALPDDVRIPQDLVLGLRLARRGRVALTERVIATAPDAGGDHLSRQVARMYGEFCRVIDGELADLNSASDAAYAVRRNARRCRHYFRREASGMLELRERLWLDLQAVAPWRSIAASRRALRRIEALYRRDIDRVLK
jgi:glycosyltransferase involved in cell wall biosynthesis